MENVFHGKKCSPFPFHFCGKVVAQTCPKVAKANLIVMGINGLTMAQYMHLALLRCSLSMAPSWWPLSKIQCKVPMSITHFGFICHVSFSLTSGAPTLDKRVALDWQLN
eukprot:TRINITY_DN31143_c0_g1_i1.p1 TRINITY_DN31143_c0_g1~~TRINITY_DN31143_c0_g1_i1.p1  ORF type:complete len:109 (-),score=8.01 TRINITY_DN31143_c0_g1_i1:802-1128(-)